MCRTLRFCCPRLSLVSHLLCVLSEAPPLWAQRTCRTGAAAGKPSETIWNAEPEAAGCDRFVLQVGKAWGQRSEYHRQFGWKKPVPAASPLLTAEQVRKTSKHDNFLFSIRKHERRSLGEVWMLIGVSLARTGEMTHCLFLSKTKGKSSNR